MTLAIRCTLVLPFVVVIGSVILENMEPLPKGVGRLALALLRPGGIRMGDIFDECEHFGPQPGILVRCQEMVPVEHLEGERRRRVPPPTGQRRPANERVVFATEHMNRTWQPRLGAIRMGEAELQISSYAFQESTHPLRSIKKLGGQPADGVESDRQPGIVKIDHGGQWRDQMWRRARRHDEGVSHSLARSPSVFGHLVRHQTTHAVPEQDMRLVEDIGQVMRQQLSKNRHVGRQGLAVSTVPAREAHWVNVDLRFGVPSPRPKGRSAATGMRETHQRRGS
nr:hypothetical protein [Kibdelosporangium aridum]